MAFLEYLLNFGVWLLRMALLPVKLYFSLQRPKRCPPIEDNLLKIPAIQLAEKIRKKEVTSEEVVLAYIARVKAVNPILNAVVQDRFSEAAQEAKCVDKLIASEEFSEEDMRIKKPLLGIPFTVKESVPVEGMSNRAGSLMYNRERADKDDKLVQLMKEAGAIPLLVSNTPELCMNWETNNKITGRTNNPYDTRRTCGGSSGGEASLLGSGASLIGLGSDVGGSLRIPPHFCGVWGHKPTPRTVFCEDHFPNCEDKEIWPEVFTTGPMARYAVDLPLLLDVIATEDARPKLNLREKMWVYRPILKISWMDRETNENAIRRIGKEPELIFTIKRRKLEYLGHVMRGEKYQLLQLIIQVKIEGKRNVGRRRTSWLKNLREWFNCTSNQLFRSAANKVKIAMIIANLRTETAPVEDNSIEDIKNIKIYYMENDGGSALTNKVDRQIVEGMRKFVVHLQSVHGIQAQQIKMPEMKYSPSALYSLLQLDDVTSVVKNGKSTTQEYLKYIFGCSRATFLPVLHAFYQPIVKRLTSKARIDQVEENLDRTKDKLLKILGNDGVLLYPNYPTAAHFHGQIYCKVFDTSYLAVFNIFGLPSTACTLGLKSNGLPIGIQAVTAPYNDRLSLRVAEEIEIALGGWTPPPSETPKKSPKDIPC